MATETESGEREAKSRAGVGVALQVPEQNEGTALGLPKTVKSGAAADV